MLLAGGLLLAGLLNGVNVVPPAGETCIESCIQPGGFALLIALGLISLLSAVTVVQRILHVKRQLDQIDR